MPSAQTLVRNNLGIIITRAAQYWRLLPPSVQTIYDRDDMVNDLVVTVMKSMSRKHRPNSRFQAGRVKAVTFISVVAENQCRTILQYHRAQKRGEYTMKVHLDDHEPYQDQGPRRHLRVEGELSRRNEGRSEVQMAKDSVEVLIKQASPRLRDFLASFFNEEGADPLPKRNRDFLPVETELKVLMKRNSVTLQDLCLVRRHLVR